jgi:DNA-binding transcriptional MerR regulator/methylmalonyl-CoA mutase cobalamin-binding subunit
VGRYSIKELEKLSGIKAHTIRIWEKRHNIIQPERTSTNIRFYSDEDLKKIINVSMLNNHGVKISKIAGMSSAEISRMILDMTSSQTTASGYIEQLVVAMIDLEEEHFEKTLASLVRKFGFERTVTEAIYPFLEKIGILWQTRNITPAQEHFVSNLIRQKIIAAIDALPLATGSKRKVLLFLPEYEMHELGLLFNYYLVKQAGFKAYYLGQNVPHEDLVGIVATHEPQTLVTSIINPMLGGVTSYLTRLSERFPGQQILVSGIQASDLPLKPLPNVKAFNNALKFKELIAQL